MLRKISLLFVFFSLLIPSLLAQPNPNGLPWIQNYHFSETGGSEQNWCITQDFRGLIYVGNQDQGILEYDGSTWRTIPVPGELAVRSLVSGEDGIIYVGLEGDYGRLEPDKSGDLCFRSLLDSTAKSLFPDAIIWKTYFEEDKIYFCGQEAIFVFDPVSESTSIIETTETTLFSYFINNVLYMSDYRLGLMKYNGESFTPISGGELFKENNISGLVSFDSTHFLVATFYEGLFLLDLKNGTADSTFVDPELKERLSTAMIVDLQVHENRIYVCTLYEGLFILDKQGILMEAYSEREGLLDNATIQVHISPHNKSSNPVWIAHWKGVSRVDNHSPFRILSVGQGRTGLGGRNTGELITDITEFQGQQYVSTMGGLQIRSNNKERSGFRPVRGIREEIFDLQVMKPSPGIELLLASGTDQTFVIDQNMKLSTLPLGGHKVLTDPDNPAVFYIAKDDFSSYQYIHGQWKEVRKIELEEEINKMCIDKFGYVWLSSWSGLVRLDLSKAGEVEPKLYGEANGLPAAEYLELFTEPERQGLLVGTPEGFYQYDYLRDTMLYDSLYNGILPPGSNYIQALHKGSDDIYWFSFENEHSGWKVMGARKSKTSFQVIYDRPFKSLSRTVSTDVFYTDADSQLWFSRANELYHFDPGRIMDVEESFNVLIRNVRISVDSVLFNGTNFFTDPEGKLRTCKAQSEDSQPNLKYLYKELEFRWSAPYFMHERQIRYSYLLQGFSSEWSDWDRAKSTKFTNLSHGHYMIQVKARNIYGEESLPAAYAFSILRPWYSTVLALSLYLILLSSLIVFVMLYTRKLRLRAELLERQNREIELQKEELENLNEEITAQRDEIEAQRDSITLQKELIDRQKTAMTDSIHYARRIQDAVLPAKEVMRFLLPKHFIFYRPRDIVSGDFFWVDKKDETVLIAVADCTGHGVPGAFMSMLGISLLNEISSKYSGHSTNELMDELRDQVIASLRQTGDKNEAKDGMEMGMISINIKTRELQFTGAMHNLYTFQKGELVVVKGDRMPVGIHSEGSTQFSAHKLKLERGDTLYLFSDGYADQFGGKNRKKYGSSRLKNLLSELQQRIMHDQLAVIAKEFDDWKGEQEQIDDVVMIGIKL